MSKAVDDWKALFVRYFGVPLYFATPVLFVLFLGFIAYAAFLHLFVETNGQWWVAAVSAVVLAVVVRYGMGYVTYLVHREGGFRAIGKLGWVVLAVLFFVSGYSLIFSMVVVNHGPTVVAKTAADAGNSFRHMLGASHEMVYGGEYAAFLSRVEGGKASLKREIFNERPQARTGKSANTCGIGDSARAVIRKLKEDLPNLEVISSTDTMHDCNRKAELEWINKQYVDAIDEQAALVVQTKFRLKERERYLSELSLAARDNITRLERLSGQVVEVGAQLDLPLLLNAQRALLRAETDYAKQQAALSRLSLGQPAGLPAAIDVSQATDVMSWFGIVPFVAKSLGLNRQTAMTILAFVWDFLMLKLLALYAGQWAERRRRYAINGSVDNIDGSGVAYLLRPAS